MATGQAPGASAPDAGGVEEAGRRELTSGDAAQLIDVFEQEGVG